MPPGGERRLTTSPEITRRPPDRPARIAAFLERAGWGEARRWALAGDASVRRYERLSAPDGRRAVLMDADPATGQDVGAFARVARHLAQAGLAPPAILAADHDAGLLLLEDLGDALFARVVEDAPESEMRLYSAAIDALAVLHAEPVPDWAEPYGVRRMTENALLAYDWYAAGAGHAVDPVARAEADGLLHAHIAALDETPPVLCLRDFHAENLIWVPERPGPLSVGLLDFQDARTCHPAYDLTSLLRDARRDVPAPVRDAMTARYLAATGRDSDRFAKDAAVCVAERNLRILGVFARLSLHYGKPHYVDLMPRVWDHMVAGLSHPDLAALRDRVLADLPAPAPDHLAILKDRCGTVPTP